MVWLLFFWTPPLSPLFGFSPSLVFSLGAAVDLASQCSPHAKNGTTILKKKILSILWLPSPAQKNNLSSFLYFLSLVHLRILFLQIQQGRYVLISSIAGWIASEYRQTVAYVASKTASWILLKNPTDSHQTAAPKYPSFFPFWICALSTFLLSCGCQKIFPRISCKTNKK